MRLKRLLLIAAIFCAHDANAKPACEHGSPDVLEMLEWTTTHGDQSAGITLKVFNPNDREINRIDATAWFKDAAGAVIGQIKIDPDLHLEASKFIYDVSDLPWAGGLEAVARKDISGVICTLSVLFVDGTAQEFK
ncbi:hypothetical protein [Mesorhizobium sanjuanii]|nr:hypothetical protein [Mesorhizobium sanjuanii]